ncbi:hypothetical protein CGZ93_17560 [Enemella dayhoffiae]|uniref:Metallo-beta-lactamase domain-containing protein n=1 Tax=Enemella dayhoffiae TaxID=2016507 RepID=A0A255GLY0_9ACTN|nr:MBL fold metallo-hydrolase [Enemella dayhoffiae]OYO16571.1 hypothetical protein CGZ93_17560 [Enemella dayhoffiae]
MSNRGGESVSALFPVQGEAWSRREAPPVTEVADRIWAAPIPVPGQGIRFVYSYLIADGSGGMTVVDPGWNSTEARAALGAAVARTGHRIDDVDTLLVTHAHPDHLGMAGDLARETGAQVFLHDADCLLLPEVRGDLDYVSLDRWLREHGQPLDPDPGTAMDGVVFADMERPSHRLHDGQEFRVGDRRLRVLHTPGHTPGHACFVVEDEHLVLTGDHLLPRISPNVSGFPRSGPDPLGRFLDSLGLIARLDPAVALPSHEYAFADLGERVAQVERHHTARLAEICDRLADTPGMNADELSQRLTWSRPWSEIRPAMRRAALAETLAHLLRLVELGQVRAWTRREVRVWSLAR